MKKIIPYFFLAIYAAAGMLFILFVLEFFGIYIDPVCEILFVLAWTGLCFTAYLWVPKTFLAFDRIRKTTLEEEDSIHPLMHELNLRTGIAPELLIHETPVMSSFATGKATIVITRGLLVQLSTPELKAVLAHEYGHLRDGDTHLTSAFWTAEKPLWLFYRLLMPAIFFCKKWFWKKGGVVATLQGLLLLAILFFSSPDLLLKAIFVILFILCYPYLRSFMTLVWRYFTRNMEFRQDRFAHLLGSGRHLKSALLKIDAVDSENFVSKVNGIWSAHPMLYIRIRKLEWLEGLRPTP